MNSFLSLLLLALTSVRAASTEGRVAALVSRMAPSGDFRSVAGFEVQGRVDMPMNIGSPSDVGFSAEQPWTATAWVRMVAADHFEIFGGDGISVKVNEGGFYQVNDCTSSQRAMKHQWEYVAVSFTPGEFRIYVDGKQVAECHRQNLRIWSQRDMYIGIGGSSERGQVKDVKVFKNAALSASVIKQLAGETCDTNEIKEAIIAELGWKLRLHLIKPCYEFGEAMKNLDFSDPAKAMAEMKGPTCECLAKLPDNFLKEKFSCSIHGMNMYQTVQGMCWPEGRDHCADRWAYGRGAGEILTQCPEGKEKIGLLCYSKCPRGYYRSGFDCHQHCTAGFRDDGLFCRKAEYGRGWGYAWKFGDTLWSFSGQWSRCEKDHGRGNCEKAGLLIYPKCKKGYWPVTVNICRPTMPNCLDLGYHGQFDLSCSKKTIVGDPRPMQCADHLEQSGLLCYEPCDHGYWGAGPMCHPDRNCNPTPRPTVLQATPRPTHTPRPTPNPTPNPTHRGAEPTPKPTPNPTRPPIAPRCDIGTITEKLMEKAGGNFMLLLKCSPLLKFKNQLPKDIDETTDTACGCLNALDEHTLKQTVDCRINNFNIYVDVYPTCKRGRRRNVLPAPTPEEAQMQAPTPEEHQRRSEQEPVIHFSDMGMHVDDSVGLAELVFMTLALHKRLGSSWSDASWLESLQDLDLDERFDESWGVGVAYSLNLQFKPSLEHLIQNMGGEIGALSLVPADELLAIADLLLEPYGASLDDILASTDDDASLTAVRASLAEIMHLVEDVLF